MRLLKLLGLITLSTLPIYTHTRVSYPIPNLNDYSRDMEKNPKPSSRPNTPSKPPPSDDVPAPQKYCAAAPARPQDRRENKDKVVFMHLNAEFLFHPDVYGNHCSKKPYTRSPKQSPPESDVVHTQWGDLYNMHVDVQKLVEKVDQGKGGSKPVCKVWPTPAINVDHIRNIARVIERNNADVINMCEISDCAVLEMLLTFMSPQAAAKYRPYVVEQADSSTGQHCGLLTKIDISRNMTSTRERVDIPLPNSQCPQHKSKKRQSVSKNYQTAIRLANGKNVHLFGMHFLAFPDNVERCHDREGQAYLVRQMLDKTVQPEDYVVVMGDMNDYDRRITDSGSSTELGHPITHALDILAALNTTKQTPHTQLDNVLSLMDDKHVHYTATFGYPAVKWSVIDHALIDKRLTNAVTLVEVPMVYKAWTHERCSDHFPIKFTLDLAVLNGNATRESRKLQPEDVPTNINDLEAFRNCSTIHPLPSDTHLGGVRVDGRYEMVRRVRCLQKSVGARADVTDEECSA
eukprot:GDKI01034261.1.p1 GENE.GDKI01034261.1~~GDKI01034261.1.p1  ORF type:complete len:517 (+),score=130.33 GDKI01034261.1:121-1671(+)